MTKRVPLTVQENGLDIIIGEVEIEVDEVGGIVTSKATITDERYAYMFAPPLVVSIDGERNEPQVPVFPDPCNSRGDHAADLPKPE